MRWVVFLVCASGLLALAGCDDKGSAQAGGTSKGGYGQVKVGLPF